MNNPFVSCPYNPAHRVLQSRIQGHIVKCEKNYPPLEICPYNATHRLSKSEMVKHIADCPSKVVQSESITLDKKVVHIINKAKFVGQPFPHPTDPDYECWD